MHYHWFYLFAIFFGIVNGQVNNRYTFKKAGVSKCVKEYLLNWGDNYFKENTRIAQIIATKATRKVKTRTYYTYDSLDRVSYRIYEELRTKIVRNQKIDGTIRLTIRRALINCAEILKIHQILQEPYVNTFRGEIPNLSQVLDYILVDWRIVP